MKKAINLIIKISFIIYIFALCVILFGGSRGHWADFSILQYAAMQMNLVPFETIALYIRAMVRGTINLEIAIANLLGNFLFAKLHRSPWSRYIYIGLFGICLGPVVKEMVYLLPFTSEINLLCAFLIGVVIGFILPPLSAHTTSMHLGYNLFNVGFSAGILAFAINCICCFASTFI